MEKEAKDLRSASPKLSRIENLTSGLLAGNNQEDMFLIREVEGKGRGVFLKAPILPKDSFVVEYQGEIISAAEADIREEIYSSNGEGCFIMYFTFKNMNLAVDATRAFGTFGRLLNHSKLPNVRFHTPIVIDLMKGTPRIAAYALRDIIKGEEIVMDYGVQDGGIPWLKNREAGFLEDVDGDPNSADLKLQKAGTLPGIVSNNKKKVNQITGFVLKSFLPKGRKRYYFAGLKTFNEPEVIRRVPDEPCTKKICKQKPHSDASVAICRQLNGKRLSVNEKEQGLSCETPYCSGVFSDKAVYAVLSHVKNEYNNDLSDVSSEKREAHYAELTSQKIHNTNDVGRDRREVTHNISNARRAKRQAVHAFDGRRDRGEIFRITNSVVKDKSEVVHFTSDEGRDRREVTHNISNARRAKRQAVHTFDGRRDRSEILRITNNVVKDKSEVVHFTSDEGRDRGEDIHFTDDEGREKDEYIHFTNDEGREKDEDIHFTDDEGREKDEDIYFTNDEGRDFSEVIQFTNDEGKDTSEIFEYTCERREHLMKPSQVNFPLHQCSISLNKEVVTKFILNSSIEKRREAVLCELSNIISSGDPSLVTTLTTENGTTIQSELLPKSLQRRGSARFLSASPRVAVIKPYLLNQTSCKENRLDAREETDKASATITEFEKEHLRLLFQGYQSVDKVCISDIEKTFMENKMFVVKLLTRGITIHQISSTVSQFFVNTLNGKH